MSGNEIDFNCECESTSSFDTLQTLRRRLALRGGYASQADNLPTGVSAMFDDYLQSAQKLLYVKNPSLRTERFYRWTMNSTSGRYFGITDSDVDTELACDKQPLAERVTWVGIEDVNGQWHTLTAGIDPTFYTTATQRGMPSCYEIRSCIEIFPAPDAHYHLWVKGHFALDTFTANSHRTTIDSELVFLLALGNFKTDKGQNGAQNLLNQVGQYLVDLKAGRHTTRRYIPRLSAIPPAVRPRFLPLVS